MPAYHNTTPLADWSGCTRCRLHTTRRNVITRRSGFIDNGVITHTAFFDKPNPTLPIPHVLFIGEAPGSLEDNTGLAFWGPAGRILTLVLKESSQAHPNYKFIKPDNPEAESLRKKFGSISYYFTITNTVCCRPTHTQETTVAAHKHGCQRSPVAAEINICKPHINELFLCPLRITHVVCLGEVANQTYNSLSHPIPALHLTHPAGILRQNYYALPIIKVGRQLRTWITTNH